MWRCTAASTRFRQDSSRPRAQGTHRLQRTRSRRCTSSSPRDIRRRILAHRPRTPSRSTWSRRSSLSANGTGGSRSAAGRLPGTTPTPHRPRFVRSNRMPDPSLPSLPSLPTPTPNPSRSSQSFLVPIRSMRRRRPARGPRPHRPNRSRSRRPGRSPRVEERRPNRSPPRGRAPSAPRVLSGRLASRERPHDRPLRGIGEGNIDADRGRRRRAPETSRVAPKTVRAHVSGVLSGGRAAPRRARKSAPARCAGGPDRPVPRDLGAAVRQRGGLRAGARTAAAAARRAVDDKTPVVLAGDGERLSARGLDGDRTGELARHVLAVASAACGLEKSKRDRAEARSGAVRRGVVRRGSRLDAGVLRRNACVRTGGFRGGSVSAVARRRRNRVLRGPARVERGVRDAPVGFAHGRRTPRAPARDEGRKSACRQAQGHGAQACACEGVTPDLRHEGSPGAIHGPAREPAHGGPFLGAGGLGGEQDLPQVGSLSAKPGRGDHAAGGFTPAGRSPRCRWPCASPLPSGSARATRSSSSRAGARRRTAASTP